MFEKRVSGLHNTASTEMKQRQRARKRERERDGEKEAERESKKEEEKKKNSCAALTDDLTGETEFVFCREMSDALPVREREREREMERGREKAHHRISPASFSPSLFSSGLRRLGECNDIKGPRHSECTLLFQ